MYSIVQRPDKSCDVFLDWKPIGVWRGLVFYPEPSYAAKGTPISLMRFLLSEHNKEWERKGCK